MVGVGFAWVAQSIVALILPLAMLVIAVGLVEDGHPLGDARAVQFLNSLEFVVQTLFGCVCGYLVRGIFPSAASAGRWVWPLPVAVFLFVAVETALRAPSDFPGLFGRGPGEAVLGAIFVTDPALASVGYSLGVILPRRSSGKRGVSPSLL